MSDLIDTLRAIVRDELSRQRPAELGAVTEIHTSEGDNHQVNLRLLSLGVELVRVPVAVGRLGLSSLPQVGDLMVVAFMGGDINAPVALGCVYDDTAHPPKAEAHEVVYHLPDEASESPRRLHLETAGGSKITVWDSKVTIELGETQVVVEKDGDVTILAKGAVSVEAGGDLTLSAGGDLTLSAKGNASLKGTATTVEGAAEVKIKAAQIAIAGLTQFSPS